MYDDLSDEERQIIEKAIINYAIKIFGDQNYMNYFMGEGSSKNTNRNQVINSGIGMCALVLLNSDYQLVKVNGQLDENGYEIDNIFNIMDANGELLKQNNENIQININNSILNDMLDEDNKILNFNDLLCAIIAKSINLQATFFENKLNGGGYPEGLGYYRYGMVFTNYFVSSLYNLSGTEFGICSIDGLYDSLLYPVYMGGNSDKIFNYGDVTKSSSDIGSISNTGMVWLANYYILVGKTQNAYLLYNLEMKYNWGLYNILWCKEENVINARDFSEFDRDHLFENISVVALNESLDRKTNDIFIATKAGKIQRSHGDLDIGSYVFDALGERWIEDFGYESYTAPYIDNFRYGRWNYYKKRAEGHSTLVISPYLGKAKKDGDNPYFVDADQYIYAECPIHQDKFEKNEDSAYVTMNITDAYNRYNKNEQSDSPSINMTKVERTIGVYNNRSIAKIKDEISLDKQRYVYSFLNIANDVSSIDISEDGKSAVIQKENGKKVKVKLVYDLEAPGGKKVDAELQTMKKVPLNDFLKGINDFTDNTEYDFEKNLEYKDNDKLFVYTFAYKGYMEIQLIPVYIYNVDVKYSNTEITTEPVKVTITADERMQNVEGWTLSEDKKELTREYTGNVNEEIKILDLAGNETIKTIEINNIDHGGLDSIEISKSPEKTNYIEEQNFIKDGMEINVKYNDGYTQIINSNSKNLTIVDGDNLIVGKESVTIRYTENGVTKETTQGITVAAKEMEKIEVITAPTKTNYIEGQSFEKAGIVVTVTYNNGTTKTVNADDENLTIVDGDNLTVGKESVTIRYTENGATKETTQGITVESELITIELPKTYNTTKQGEYTYIANIEPNTTVESIENNIKTSGNISIYKNGAEISDKNTKIATGMKIRVYNEYKSYEFILSVLGDTNGDGEASIKDILAINKHRLGKALLKNEFEIAGDVNKDGKVDIKDLLQINKFRLGKIKNL